MAQLHQVCILDAIVVEVPQDRRGTKAEGAKKQLGGEICLTYFQHDSIATLMRELAYQLLYHVPANSLLLQVRMDSEVEDMQVILVEFIDHEPDDLLVVLGHHADTVSLTQATNEIFFGPGELETAALDFQDVRHIPPDHPANMV